jgi:hypothetical protein
LKLLVDHNLSYRIANALQILFPEHQIVALRDKFAPNIADIDWITALSDAGGWAVLTKDIRIRTRPHERAVLDRSKVVYFFLSGAWKNYKIDETAARLIRWVPKMAAQTTLADRGRFELPINSGSKLRPQQD